MAITQPIDQTATANVEILAGKGVRSGPDFVVPIELRGTLDNGRDVVHARADVVLALDVLDLDGALRVRSGPTMRDRGAVAAGRQYAEVHSRRREA